MYDKITDRLGIVTYYGKTLAKIYILYYSVYYKGFSDKTHRRKQTVCDSEYEKRHNNGNNIDNKKHYTDVI